VAKASELAKAKGAKRVIPLVVGGPFHTPLVHNASLWLAQEMENIQFRDTTIPLISNVDALPNTSGKISKEKLAKQVISPVLWVDCVRRMIQDGVRHFIEFGPQKVLSGMIKNIDRDVQVFNMEKIDDWKTIDAAFKE
jgi:[acyl-carrier-protein] S-malonyltransferase